MADFDMPLPDGTVEEYVTRLVQRLRGVLQNLDRGNFSSAFEAELEAVLTRQAELEKRVRELENALRALRRSQSE